MSRTLRATVGLALAALGATLVSGPAVAAEPTSQPVTVSAASAAEERRVDAVATPVLDWKPCDLGECATAALPLDYDNPHGATVTVALTRIKARDQKHRIGSLFLNPGGPGAQGTDFPQRALKWVGDDVRDRFDLVGFDPRGTWESTNTHCFKNPRRQDQSTGVMSDMFFPVTAAETSRFTAAASSLAKACSGSNRTFVSSMSTSEVARDLDVLRRAVGDAKLSYLGFSYGTYLGQVYAAMFPDRVRAMTLDGVVDPRAWVGTPQTADIPMSARMGSALGSEAALHELLARCGAAGSACPLSDPEAALARVVTRLKAAPLVFTDPDGNQNTVTYQGFVTGMLYALYNQETVESIPELIAFIDQLQSASAAPAQQAQAAAGYSRVAARVQATGAQYDNRVEQVPAVMCTDSLNPWDPAAWARQSAVEDARAPIFGRHWLWGSAPCATKFWKAHDEDAWTGPFDTRTPNPVLVVGSLHDPATSYASAQAVAALLPNSRLLTSNNWGHTAYGLSTCATSTIDAYLLDPTASTADVTCTDGWQPYAG